MRHYVIANTERNVPLLLLMYSSNTTGDGRTVKADSLRTRGFRSAGSPDACGRRTFPPNADSRQGARGCSLGALAAEGDHR